jgi:hypothetical protein
MQESNTIPTPPKSKWRRWLLFAGIGVASCCVLSVIIVQFAPDTPTAADNQTSPTATAEATLVPTTVPTAVPTAIPTEVPTVIPTNTQAPTETEAPTATDAPVTPLSVDDYLNQTVSDTLGTRTNYEQLRLVEVTTLFGATPDEKGNKMVTIRANKNLSNKLIVAGMLVDAVNYYATIAKNEDVMKLTSVTILFMLPMTDNYGNTEEIGVSRIYLKIDTIRKINWDTFKRGGHRRLPDAADTYFLNSALR